MTITPPFGVIVRSPDDHLSPGLRRALTTLARTPQLLVLCDYDGTISPIVDRPSDARPLPEAVTALRALALLPATHVAVVSGRSLRDLAALSRLPHEVHLVGSHGGEFDLGFVDALDADAVAMRDRLVDEAYRIAGGRHGVLVEVKPASVAVHVRMASRPDADEVTAAVLEGPATWPGVHVRRGHEVVELAAVPTSKAHALDALRHRLGASAALVVGDDVTDEDAFGRAHGPDVAVRVGPGDTVAPFRVPAPVDVARLLALVLEERRSWLFGGRAVPIERHSMLADGRTVALLAPDATVTWLCAPAPDSPALFADLLGGPEAGAMTVGPGHGGRPIGQRYLPDTMTVETRWAGLTVLDELVLPHDDDEGSTLLRTITGSGTAQLCFRPRPDFGRVHCRLETAEDGDALVVVGSPDPVVLRAPGVRWTVTREPDGDTARASVWLADEPVVCELRLGSAVTGAHPVPHAERRRRSEDRRRQWVAALQLPREERDLVARSALVLKGLCHEPTGGVLAAATTSLPEEIGGVRNWDYRACWVRDGAMTVRSLVRLGSTTEAVAFLHWLHRILGRIGSPERLHPLYALEGHGLSAEAVIDTLPGYAGSRPVRVGNAAEHQVQLDVFGPVVDLVLALAECGHPIDDDTWDVVEAMVAAVAARWQEPDHGIWEERRAPRHHVQGKVMCWLAVDGATRLAALLGRSAPEAWPVLARAIRDDVLAHGWNSQVQSLTSAYGDDDLDASVLWAVLSGLLEPSDHRAAATVAAIELGLRQGPTVYRYRVDDGLPGTEGGFHLCALWLLQTYVLMGREADARTLWAQLVDLVGPTGLLPEEYDPVSERHLGNHPQAYSHLGLIDAAVLLDRLDPR